MYNKTVQQQISLRVEWSTLEKTVQQAKRRKAWATMHKAAQQAAANRITFQPFAY